MPRAHITLMRPLCLIAAAAVLALAGVASAQLGDSSFDQLDHPAIQYTTRAARDPVAALNSRIQAGDLQLSFDAGHGYLPSLLRALEIAIENLASQGIMPCESHALQDLLCHRLFAHGGPDL